MANKPTIMVIEDESLVAKDIQNMLVTMGYNVPYVLFSGLDAVKAVEEAAPDLILMDIGLKGAIDGITTAERIKNKHDIPIIYLTAYSDEKTIDRAQRTEPYGYILKPFETSELHTTVDMALKRHKMEVALRANENLLKCTLESTIDGILVVDDKGKVSHANSRFAEMWKIPGDLLETEDDTKLLNYVLDQLDYPEVFFNKVQQLYRTDEESFDTLTFKDGRVFERYTRPLLQGSRNVGRIWSFRDVTGKGQLKGAERNGDERNIDARCRALLESLPLAMIGVTTEGLICYWNCHAEKIFGPKAAQILGQPLDDCGIDWDGQLLESLLSRCREGKKNEEGYEIRYKNVDGKARCLDLTLIACADILFIAAQDLSERKMLQEQLQLSQKFESIGRLAAGIAHEINTPIQYIGDNTVFFKDSFSTISHLFEACDFLKPMAKISALSERQLNECRRAYADAEIDYLIDEIPAAIEQTLEGVGRVASIVRAMKDFSHPSAKEMSYADLNRAIETTITVARNEWKYVAEMHTDLDEGLPLIACYPDEFNQVILNMIINAAHAVSDAVGDGSRGKGKIMLRTRRDGESAEIAIADTGVGIPENVRSKIFEPFYTTKGLGKGTGQGLAIAQRAIIGKLGGSISVESEVGRGTTFIIRIPIKEIEEFEGAENEKADIICR